MDRMTTPTLGSWELSEREERGERERERRVLENGRAAGIAVKGLTRPVARTQAYRRYRLQRALEWLISDAPRTRTSHGHEEGKGQVYIYPIGRMPPS